MKFKYDIEQTYLEKVLKELKTIGSAGVVFSYYIINDEKKFSTPIGDSLYFKNPEELKNGIEKSANEIMAKCFKTENVKFRKCGIAVYNKEKMEFGVVKEIEQIEA